MVSRGSSREAWRIYALSGGMMGRIYFVDERTGTKPMKRSASLGHPNLIGNRPHTDAVKWREQEFTIRVWLIRLCAQALQVTVCVSTWRK
jgi:hypothetical protein